MAKSVLIQVTDSSNRSQTDLNNMVLRCDSTNPKGEIADLVDYLNRIASGHAANIDVSTGSAGNVAASAVVTCASVSNADTVTINGVVFTATTGTPSGNQFLVGVTDTADAAALAAIINSSATAGIPGIVTASSAIGVVTLSAALKGLIGNTITVTTSNNTRLALTGTTTRTAVKYFSGGTGGDGGSASVNFVYAG